jgi:1,4-alpha-glucan branching enzyme
MALHKMIRLITATCAGEGYMNFMGNEFGHPEWIDFPREGNDWSFYYARRQWSLADDESLRFQYLLSFDKAMVELLKNNEILNNAAELILHDEPAKVLVFRKGVYLFLFNFNPTNEYKARIKLDFRAGIKMCLDCDWEIFGGCTEKGSGEEVDVDKVKNGVFLNIAIKNRNALVYQVEY